MSILPQHIVDLSNAVIQPVSLSHAYPQTLALDVLRLDAIDPLISGNKWFKLKYYLQQAMTNSVKSVLTFGGAWSNHLLATAAAAHKLNIDAIGLVRGEAPAQYSSTLHTAHELGMQLQFLTRQQYDAYKQPGFESQLQELYPSSLIIPEGGAGVTGVRGATDIGALFDGKAYDYILCAVGTGTMLSGIAKAMSPECRLIGVPVLKGFEQWRPEYLTAEQQARVDILPGYHWGGYARQQPALISFMNEWYRQTGIPSDFVYTGKLFFALAELLKQHYFPGGSRILAVHSGGLQGNASLKKGQLEF